MQGTTFMGFSIAEVQTSLKDSRYLEIKDQMLWFNLLKLWGLGMGKGNG